MRPTYWIGISRIVDPSIAVIVTSEEVVTMRSWRTTA